MACDAPVTDYSSVLFDYSLTGKKILLDLHDKAENIRMKQDCKFNRKIYHLRKLIHFQIFNCFE